MKKLTIGTVMLGIVLATLITMGFRKAFIPDHKYTVTLTEKEWESWLQSIQNGAVGLRTSTLPGNQIAAIQDSLISIQQTIQRQVGPQIAADTLVKPKK